jgi:hypothetical protein
LNTPQSHTRQRIQDVLALSHNISLAFDHTLYLEGNSAAAVRSVHGPNRSNKTLALVIDLLAAQIDDPHLNQVYLCPTEDIAQAVFAETGRLLSALNRTTALAARLFSRTVLCPDPETRTLWAIPHTVNLANAEFDVDRHWGKHGIHFCTPGDVSLSGGGEDEGPGMTVRGKPSLCPHRLYVDDLDLMTTPDFIEAVLPALIHRNMPVSLGYSVALS